VVVLDAPEESQVRSLIAGALAAPADGHGPEEVP